MVHSTFDRGKPHGKPDDEVGNCEQGQLAHWRPLEKQSHPAALKIPHSQTIHHSTRSKYHTFIQRMSSTPAMVWHPQSPLLTTAFVQRIPAFNHGLGLGLDHVVRNSVNGRTWSQTLAEPGRTWQNLAEPGRTWSQTLAEPGRTWQHLAEPGKTWQNLATPGRTWQNLKPDVG